MPRPTTTRRLTTLAAASTALLCCLPAADASAADGLRDSATRTVERSLPQRAAADGAALAGTLSGTIVFIRDNDVWIARPDGSAAARLTTDGTADQPYFSPSEDDAGHIVAARGAAGAAALVRLDQAGHVLGRFAPPVGSLNTLFAQVSPGGGTVAYGALFAVPDCSFSPCHTFYTHQLHYTDATTGADLPAAGGSSIEAVHASWWGDGRVVVGDAVHYQVDLHELGQPAGNTWLSDCAGPGDDSCGGSAANHYAPTVDRLGNRYASSLVIVPPDGDPHDYLFLTDVAGSGTPVPTAPVCAFDAGTLTTTDPIPDELNVGDPSWSPDGASLVVGIRDPSTGWEIDRIDVADLADCSIGGGTILADASEPFWSPAPLAPPADPPPTLPPPTLPPPVDPTPDPPSAEAIAFTGHRLTVKGTHVVGHKVHLSRAGARLEHAFSPAARRVSFAWLRDGKPIKHAHHATYRLTRADRHHKISCRVTGKRDGHSARTRSRAVKVK